jgi:tetratricopeptide (TPR) repeat protein
VATPSYVSGSYEDLYAQGQRFRRDGELSKAREIFERIARRLEGKGDALFGRRPMLKNLYGLSISNLAELLHREEKYDEALAYYQLLLETFPENADEWHMQQGLVKIDKGDVAAGLDELRSATMIAPAKVWPWLWLGVELVSLGDYEEGEGNLQRAVERATDDPGTQSNALAHLFELYKKQMRYEEAETAWLKSERLLDLGQRLVFPIYEMYWRIGNIEKVQFWLKQEKNPLRLGLYRGLIARAEGKPAKAKAIWQTTADLNPFDFEIGHDAWAETVLRLDGDLGRVVEVLSDIVEDGLDTIRHRVLLAIAHARSGDADRARETLKRQLGSDRRPRLRKLPADVRDLVDELVPEQDVKAALAVYFEPGDR